MRIICVYEADRRTCDAAEAFDDVAREAAPILD